MEDEIKITIECFVEKFCFVDNVIVPIFFKNFRKLSNEQRLELVETLQYIPFCCFREALNIYEQYYNGKAPLKELLNYMRKVRAGCGSRL